MAYRVTLGNNGFATVSRVGVHFPTFHTHPRTPIPLSLRIRSHIGNNLARVPNARRIFEVAVRGLGEASGRIRRAVAQRVRIRSTCSRAFRARASKRAAAWPCLCSRARAASVLDISALSSKVLSATYNALSRASAFSSSTPSAV
jgi:hypothetical protein